LPTDLDAHRGAGRRVEYAIPLDRDTGAHAVLPSTRMSEDVHPRGSHGLQHPARLIVRGSQSPVRGRDPELELTAFLRFHVHGPVGKDVCFDTFDDAEASGEVAVQRVDL